MNLHPFRSLLLSNGLRVILQPLPQTNSVSVYVAVGAGPRFETQETAGLAHFLEHMLFEGTKNLPTSRNVAEYIERIGGKSGAFTNKEYVIYYTKVTPHHLETAIDYLSEILFNSTLNAGAIEKEKDIISEEIKRKEDNPEVEAWDLWLEWVWEKKQAWRYKNSEKCNEREIVEVHEKSLPSNQYGCYDCREFFIRRS